LEVAARRRRFGGALRAPALEIGVADIEALKKELDVWRR
jgi:hypothetical protein